MWSIVENTWLNALGIILLLTMNINKRCWRMFIWYTFKTFNCLIKSLDEIEKYHQKTLFQPLGFVFLEFVLDRFCMYYPLKYWHSLHMDAKNILCKDFEFKKQLALNKIPTLFEILFSSNSKWVFQVKFLSIITPKNICEFSFLILALLITKSGRTRGRLSLLFTLWDNTYLVSSLFREIFM